MKRHECLGCGKMMRKSLTICQECLRTKEIRNRLGIKTAADYQLSRRDYLHNALCFLHACGQLEDVMDKIESQVPEIMMTSTTSVNNNPNNLINSYRIELYDKFKVLPTIVKKKDTGG